MKSQFTTFILILVTIVLLAFAVYMIFRHPEPAIDPEHPMVLEQKLPTDDQKYQKMSPQKE